MIQQDTMGALWDLTDTLFKIRAVVAPNMSNTYTLEKSQPTVQYITNLNAFALEVLQHARVCLE